MARFIVTKAMSWVGEYYLEVEAETEVDALEQAKKAPTEAWDYSQGPDCPEDTGDGWEVEQV